MNKIAKTIVYMILFTLLFSFTLSECKAECNNHDFNGDGVVDLADVINFAMYIYNVGTIVNCPDRYDIYPDSVVHYDTIIDGAHLRLVENIILDTNWSYYNWRKTGYYKNSNMIDLYSHVFSSYRNDSLIDYWSAPQTFIERTWDGKIWDIDSGIYSLNDVEFAMVGTNRVSLFWTAPPGDSIANYLIRYNTVPIDTLNWDTSQSKTKPFKPFCREKFLLTGLSPDTQYWVEIRLIDRTGKIGKLSNQVTFRTRS